MTSTQKPEASRTEAADHLATLVQRRGELISAADDAHVLSELTSLERRIAAAGTGTLAYDLVA